MPRNYEAETVAMLGMVNAKLDAQAARIDSLTASLDVLTRSVKIAVRRAPGDAGAKQVESKRSALGGRDGNGQTTRNTAGATRQGHSGLQSRGANLGE